ncbi:MAG TPA: hypothetical protein VKE22_25700 [Haliangiales bacterium]|nr:hypothetical protein [Haliangiales bacterium]
MRQVVTLAGGLVWWTVTSACGPAERAPMLNPITNEPSLRAYVGEELSVELHATYAGSSSLTFSFRAPSIPNLATRAQIVPRDATSATFRWTPLATDAGSWDIDFEVSDGHSSGTETVTIDVAAAPSNKVPPTFVKPTGSGTTLDLTAKACLDLDIEVQDTDSTRVTIAEEPQKIDGATLTATGPFTATWHWCPTQAQIDAKDRYALQLSATDDTNQKSLRPYLIFLKKPACVGVGPTIVHTPVDASQVNDLTIDADVTDDKGLKAPPILYWSTTQPAAAPDITKMTPAEMLKISGNTYAADVPNPAAAMPAGSKVTLYYLIVASDNDDPTGRCNHTTQSPVYSMKVTNPGTPGGQGVCTTCSADSQCGGANDNCIHVGAGPDYYCGKACAADADCPTNYECPATAFTSVNGATARQCVPKTRSCTNPNPPACVDDSHEEDDDRVAAASRPALALGSTSGKSCPQTTGGGIDEDWYQLVIVDDSQVTITMTSGAATDLDLQLVNSAGTPLATSRNAAGQTETVTACLTKGSYYVGILSVSPPAENSYTLTYVGQNQSCAAMCVDDANEPDDTPATAQVATIQSADKYTQSGTICPNNSDLFWVYLQAGQTLYASLTFAQTTDAQDLDLWIWDSTFTSLLDGAATTHPNEYIEWLAPATGEYYVEISGYHGSQNTYSLCLSRNPAQCPVYPP